MFNTPDDVPDEIKNNQQYADLDWCTISQVRAMTKEYNNIDILVISLASGLEVAKPLIKASCKVYLAML